MDTLCGIGLPELLILALLSFVVIGPERSREVALQLGRWLSKIMKSPLYSDLQQTVSAIRDLPTTLVRMAELEEHQAEIEQSLRQIDQQTRLDIDSQANPRTASPEDPWDIANAVSQTSYPATPPSEQATGEEQRGVHSPPVDEELSPGSTDEDDAS